MMIAKSDILNSLPSGTILILLEKMKNMQVDMPPDSPCNKQCTGRIKQISMQKHKQCIFLKLKIRMIPLGNESNISDSAVLL